MIVKRISAALAVICLLSPALCAAGGNGGDANGEPSAVAGEEYADCAEICSDGDLTLYADMDTGRFVVRDKRNSAAWESAPVITASDKVTAGMARSNTAAELVIYYVYTEEMRFAANLETASRSSVQVSRLEDGIRVTYAFEDEEITVPVDYRLKNGGLEASIQAGAIREGDTARLIAVRLLPSFGCGTMWEQGYLFLPDGCGALVSFGQKNRSAVYEKAVYGADPDMSENYAGNQEEAVYLPVFGVAKPGAAWLGIISSGAENCSVSATGAGDRMAYNTVGAKFWYRINSRSVLFDNSFANRTSVNAYIPAFENSTVYAVSYRFLCGNEATYVGMAHAYRGYLQQRGELRKSSAAPALNVSILGSQAVKATFLGFSYTKQMPLTTYAQAQEMITALQQAGILSLSVCLEGWNRDGINNRVLNGAVKPPSCLGGKKGLTQLLAFLEKQPVTYRLGNDPIHFLSGSRKEALRTYYGKNITRRYSYLSVKGFRKDMPAYRIATPEKLLRTARQYRRAVTAAYGDVPPAFSSLGTACYTNFFKGGATQRAAYIQAVTRILALYEDVPVTLKGANAYALPYADRILDAPLSSSNYDYFAESVPFYQMVLHGTIPMSCASLTQAADQETAFLKAVEYGMELSYTGMAEQAHRLRGTELESFYGSTYTLWLQTAARQYTAYYPLLSRIAGQSMIFNGAVDEGVRKTVYENATIVFVNYSDKSVTADGVQIEPKSFAITAR